MPRKKKAAHIENSKFENSSVENVSINATPEAVSASINEDDINQSSHAAEASGSSSPDFNTPICIAHDNAAGVQLLKFPRFKQMQLSFTRPLPLEVQQRLHEDGWTFREQENCYTKQYGVQGPGAAYVEAKRYFDRLCNELSPERGQGIPF